MGYLMRKPSLEKGISPNVNVIERFVFENAQSPAL